MKTHSSDAEFAKLKEAMRRGWPVHGGFRGPKRSKWSEGIPRTCGPGQVFNGHSVSLTGFRDGADQPARGLFAIRDSGSGKDPGMPRAFAKSYRNDAPWMMPAPAEGVK